MNNDHSRSPEEREQLAQELLELHFGCHPDPESLQARLANEPALRELQAEVLRQARTLEQAVRPAQAPLRLPPTASPASPSSSPWRRLRSPQWRSPRWRLLSTAAAAAIMVGGFFMFDHFARAHHDDWQRDHLHLTVSAPRAIPAGAPWSFTVQTNDLTGAAVDCKVQWEALSDNGVVLAASEAPTKEGHATIAMAADTALRVPARIVVTANSITDSGATDSVRQVLPLSTAFAGPLVHVSTDRPVYRPGEPVFVRAVVLDRVTRLPLAEQRLVAQLLDPKGAPIAQDNAPAAALGVGSFLLRVPEGSQGGPHRVQVQSQNGRFPHESVDIVVRSFQPPQLHKEIVLDRISYAPGARGSAAVTVQRLAAGGGGAIGASARGSLVIDGTEVWNEKRVLGALGEVTFAFVIPKDVEKGAARFVATIDDAGLVETEVRPFVVPTGKVLLTAFPEGGALIAGVENGLYLECSDPLGRPIDGAGDLIDERDRSVAKFRTSHQGRAKLTFVPREGASYRARLVGHAEPFALPAVQKNGIALRLLGEDIASTDALRVAVAGRGDGPWLLGVFCRGVLVGQTTLRADENGELREQTAVTLPPTATGVLRATVFDRSLQPIAERLVRRHAPNRLDIALSAQHATLHPGQSQQVTVRTTDETGAPRPAVVGVSVSDVAALSLGSEPRVGLVDHAMLFADVERTENLGDFFLDGLPGSEHAGNVDLLLGTRGWRRFVWRNDEAARAAIAARGPLAAGTLAREGFSHTPQVVSNLEAASATGHELARAARRASRRLIDATGIAIVLLSLLGIAEFVAWLLRRTTQAPPMLQTVGGCMTAATTLFLVVVWTAMNEERTMIGSSAPTADFSRARNEAPLMLAPVDFFYESPSVAWGEQSTWPLAWCPPDWATGIGGGGGAAVLLPIPASAPAWTESLRADEESPRAGFFLPPTDIPAQWRQRQYAHQHTPSEDRRDFTSTIYWNTLVATDTNGNAAVTFATSDAVTTWRVHADAHTASGTGRLGQGSMQFSTQQPLHVEAKLPDEVSAGDSLLVPITATATEATLGELTLATTLGNGLRLGPNAPTRIPLQNGRGRVLLPLLVDSALGVTTLQMEVRGGGFVDRVQHRLTVAPRGFPHRRSLGGAVEAEKPSSGTVVIPTASVAGSGRVTLKVYPSPISALTEGLAGILREPHGCFEQASSSNYPNTLVLNLLEANGDNVPVVAARARSLLPQGYAKITSYECKQKGYEWFGADPGHEALTAYGLLQFHDMAKVHDVDAEMVQRTQNWLLSRRDGKGSFVHEGQDHHSFGGRSQVLTNAYVVYALLQAGTPASTLQSEIEALVVRAATSDPYELALIACALHLAKRPEAAAARQQLATLQRADGSLHGTTTSITASGGQDLFVETTGFAVLAWLPDAAFAGHTRSAIEFVQRCRSATGTFGATQATIVALRALTAYATTTRTMRTDGTLRVFVGERQLAERAFTALDTQAMTFELWQQLAPGEHTLRLEVEGGGGPLPWACDVSYHAETPADDPATAVSLTTQLRAASVVEGNTVALDVTVTNRTTNELPTPIAIIGLPAGCELPTRVLEDLQKSDAFAFWELRGRELVLYWRALAPSATKTLTIDLVARVPGTCTGAASRSYLYYTAEQKRWAAPLALTIAPL